MTGIRISMLIRPVGVISRLAAGLLIIVFLLIQAPVCLAGDSTPESLGDPMAGKELLSAKGCMTCHSIWGAGGDLGPDFAKVSSNKNLPEILGDFWNHTPRMIEYAGNEGIRWPKFDVQEMENVISYLYYLNLFDGPGDPDEGRIAFRRKACEKCHTVGPFGGRRAPSLDSFAHYLTPMPLAQAMWNAGDAMTRLQRRMGIEMPIFQGREMADIQAFIRRYGDRAGEATEFVEPPNPFRGEKLFIQKKCVRCHSLDKNKKLVGPSLQMIAFKKTLSEIGGILWNHSYKMRARMAALGVNVPIFKDNEMSDLIAYLYYYPFYREIGDIEGGRKLFAQKGCVSCHNARDVADMVNFGKAGEIKDYYIGFATAMWNHAPRMYERQQQKMFQWPKFYGKEMRDLVTYIYNQGNGD